MSMSALASRALLAAVVIFVMGAPSPRNASGQQAPTASSVDDLVKSLGLKKPGMSSAPDFHLLDANGSPVALSSYRGKMVLLNFWATWCGPCREEMPSMEELSRSLSGQLAVLAVNQRENAALVSKFMKAHGLNFTAPLDTTGRVAGYYRVYGIPVSYLIDAHGRAIGMKSGPMDWASAAATQVFRKLLDPGGSGAAIGSVDLEPSTPVPGVLRAKTDGVILRTQHDTLAEAIAKIRRGEDLLPLGKVLGAGEFWFMVKTKGGAVGWVRGADVEENSGGK
jgi:thiol-disulfide isomerase/thioredoxin